MIRRSEYDLGISPGFKLIVIIKRRSSNINSNVNIILIALNLKFYEMTHRQDETASTFMLKRVEFEFQNAPDREKFQTELLTLN